MILSAFSGPSAKQRKLVSSLEKSTRWYCLTTMFPLTGTVSRPLQIQVSF